MSYVYLRSSNPPPLDNRELSRTYNILEASRKLGIKNLVLASSETLLGLPFAPWVPDYIPVDENSPRRPESAYSLSKLVGEVALLPPTTPGTR